ncbi:MAG: threonine--tRNA ligase [Candidatus Levybacteria bacterium]|nr:threonine--tRNA ligase [Candidatus Levybacteria bacterium]MBP9815491.1 threonine--tRNA ligase [Candidatus Levybacteria bacterium]
MNLEKIRHSTAHLLAAAVLELYPYALITIGPAIENGFYYDIDFKNPITEVDLPKIEAKMKKILPSWNEFKEREVTANEANNIFKDNPYKLELIHELAEKNQKITLYKSGDFEDLCKGGHSVHPSQEIGAFKLLSLAGAYWKGNEKNKMLTRIYGTSFPTQIELDEYLAAVEEAKKRDHKKLGKDLDLFVFSDVVGKGLPLLTPKGSTVRRILERFIVDEELKRGYQHVYTPNLARLDLYKKSGHYPYYKDSMYAPIKIDEDEFMLRPMTCPHHFELYLSRPHSYKELPIRYAELASLYRYEKSGELSGLERVRTFTLADAHIIATKDQAEEELNRVLDLIDYVAEKLGLISGKDYFYRLSLGDRKDTKKYFKDDAAWDHAELTLKHVLEARKAPFYEAPGEAAFYGPKIDVQMKNVNGKEETAFTVQYDFVMPKRFELKYINSEGNEEQPIVIHRSSIGALERVMAFLIEKHAGAFPLWLAPTQIVLLPISDKVMDYTNEVAGELRSNGIRVDIDASNQTLGGKIRTHTLQKVPNLSIIGDKEVEKSQMDKKKYISVRLRDGKELGVVELDSFILDLQKAIEKRI